MKTRPFVVSFLSLAMLAVGCGRLTSSGAGGIDHPTDATDLVLRMDVGGGFVAPNYALARIPTWSLFGDGSVITEGPQIEIYPGPALPSVQQQVITEDGIQGILRAARDAGLMGPDASYQNRCIADASTTTFTLFADGQKHVISAYALGTEAGACPGTDDEGAARAKLAAFAAKLTDLSSWLPQGSVGEQRTFRFSETLVYVQPYSASPEPGLHQTAIDWPLSQGLASFGQSDPRFADFRCGVLDGSDLTAVRPDIERANQLTPWRSSGEEYSLIFRPLLPDQRSC